MNTNIENTDGRFKAQDDTRVKQAVEIVRTIGALPINPTAKLVAITMRTTRVVDTKQLAEMTGLSMRVVQRSKNEFAEASDTYVAHDGESSDTSDTCVANPATPATPTSLSEPRTHARIELPSGVLPSQVVKKDTPPPPKGPGKQLCLEAFGAYNETAQRCALPQAARMTPDRERKIAARLKDYGIAGWHRALANIEKSSFLTGSNDRGWRASLDFLLQAESFGKVHDGGYGNGRHAKAPVAVRMAKTESQIAAENEAMLREYGLHPECNA